MLINAIIDFGALLSLIVVFKIQRFVYLVIGNDLNSPLLFFGVNYAEWNESFPFNFSMSSRPFDIAKLGRNLGVAKESTECPCV